MTKLYEIITTILQNATDSIQEGLYEGTQLIFDNGFFNIVFSLSIVWIGFMIAFRKFSSEEMAYRFIWLIIVISFVKTITLNEYIYNTLVDWLNLPRDVFLELIHNFVTSTNSNTNIKNIIENILISLSQLTTFLFEQAGWSNITAYFYGFIVSISGLFLVFVTMLNTVFSIFLSDVVLSLMPFVLPFLIWKKSEYMFFSWVKLYVSISLYAPFTLLFGLISVQTSELTINITQAIQTDFEQNVMYIFSLVIAQLITAIAIFKIPNIINQIIGSSNEGSSLSSGVGTISAGSTAIAAISKYSGIKYAGNVLRKTPIPKHTASSGIRDSLIDDVKVR
ncbi:type IV secretion system protein [Halarcobacter sp.]|uniref:type IV secretion system protein n=1 Tax=Halarcobacter sp. TaxID=2321133 RepID=UPI002AABADCB|nr:type IV secretion system protein [Halarcobacter sp.]